MQIKNIQLPDYTQYIGKEYIILEDNYMKTSSFNRPMLKGVRFIIKKIENSQITIKITNSKQELDNLGMLNYDFVRMVNNVKKEITILKSIHKLWLDEPEKFIIDNDDYLNTNREYDTLGHCINTGYYDIPFNHPDKYGMARAYFDHTGKYTNSDTIMTLIYKRIDNKINTYTYQRGNNEYYSKNCYFFMIKGRMANLQQLQSRNSYYKKIIIGWILENKKISIKNLNKIKFEQYN